MLSPVAPFRAALRHRNLRILFAGQVTSDAGDWLYNVALLALVFDRTGSSALRRSSSRPCSPRSAPPPERPIPRASSR